MLGLKKTKPIYKKTTLFDKQINKHEMAHDVM